MKFFIPRQEARLNKKIFVFIICLLVSFFGWLQINLSKKQSETVPVEIEFSHLPKTRFGVSSITDTLLVELEADGYDLMKYEMKKVEIDFRWLKKAKNPEAYFFLPNYYTKEISRQIGESYKVLRSLTDTIQLKPSLR